MASDVRNYNAEARSTDVFGRVLCSARDQHFVIDGPPWNDCPAEAPTPGEAFLAAIAACGVELVQVLAARGGVEVGKVHVSIHGVVDPDNPLREDMTVFNRIGMTFTIEGVSQEQAAALVDGVARRCPLYGSVAASAGELAVDVQVV
jgi:uncharacterized OsmC-like protein